MNKINIVVIIHNSLLWFWLHLYFGDGLEPSRRHVRGVMMKLINCKSTRSSQAELSLFVLLNTVRLPWNWSLSDCHTSDHCPPLIHTTVLNSLTQKDCMKFTTIPLEQNRKINLINLNQNNACWKCSEHECARPWNLRPQLWDRVSFNNDWIEESVSAGHFIDGSCFLSISRFSSTTRLWPFGSQTVLKMCCCPLV